jgi:hypothetical protein
MQRTPHTNKPKRKRQKLKILRIDFLSQKAKSYPFYAEVASFLEIIEETLKGQLFPDAERCPRSFWIRVGTSPPERIKHGLTGLVCFGNHQGSIWI